MNRGLLQQVLATDNLNISQSQLRDECASVNTCLLSQIIKTLDAGSG